MVKFQTPRRLFALSTENKSHLNLPTVLLLLQTRNLSSFRAAMLSDERKFSTKQHSFPNCLTMVPLSAPPFLKQASNLKPNFQLLTNSASHVVDQLQNSILSSVDKFCTMLHILASKNPVLSGLLSFSSHLQSFSCKIPCRNYGSNNILVNHDFAAILPGDSVAGIVATNGILNFLNIYNTLLVVRLVLTWFPSAPPAIVSPLSTLCDPYLNIFRGIIPPLGGTLDLSPILAFVVLNAFTSAAAALPAELPSTELSQNLPAHRTKLYGTTLQRKWMRRLAGGKSNN